MEAQVLLYAFNSAQSRHYALLVCDHGAGIDHQRVIDALRAARLYGDGWTLYGDASDSAYFLLRDKSEATIAEATRIVSDLGYEPEDINRY